MVVGTLSPKFFWFIHWVNKLSYLNPSLEQFIQTVKGQNNFWDKIIFKWFREISMIIRILEPFKFKLEKIIGIQKRKGKYKNKYVIKAC